MAQFKQTKRKGALIRFIFGIYTVNLQDQQRRQSGDYFWLVVLRDAFLALGFLVVAFFAAAFVEAVFFATVFCEAGFLNAVFRFSGLASMAGYIDELDLAVPFGGVVVSNS